jgi:hypothetical protein
MPPHLNSSLSWRAFFSAHAEGFRFSHFSVAPKQSFSGDGLITSYLKKYSNKGHNHEKGNRIRLCATSNYVDQLFSLGHVSGATKILQIARRGVSFQPA